MTVCFLPDWAQQAASLILKEEYGYMVGIVNGKIKKVPLGEVAGKLKMVSPDDQTGSRGQNDRYQLRRLINELYCFIS